MRRYELTVAGNRGSRALTHLRVSYRIVLLWWHVAATLEFWSPGKRQLWSSEEDVRLFGLKRNQKKVALVAKEATDRKSLQREHRKTKESECEFCVNSKCFVHRVFIHKRSVYSRKENKCYINP